MKRQIDYRVARLVEVLTAKSLESGKRPSIRSIAGEIGVSERNAYKLLLKARRLGFRFGFTLNLHKLGLGLYIGYTEIPNSYTTRVFQTVEGRTLHMSLASWSMVAELVATEGSGYAARLLLGSAPALASIPFLHVNPPPRLSDEEVESMKNIIRQRLSREPPTKLWGRKYTVGDDTASLLASLMNQDALAPIARIARMMGIDEMKAQRRIRSLWNRGAIAGYSVQGAPYLPGRGIIAEAAYTDPVRFAFASIALPPIVEALISRKPDGSEVVLLRVEGADRTIAQTIRLLVEVGGDINVVSHYYSIESRQHLN